MQSVSQYLAQTFSCKEMSETLVLIEHQWILEKQGGSQQQIMITPKVSSFKQTPILPPLKSLPLNTISNS